MGGGKIVDYKIFTLGGEPELILICSDREIGVGCKLSMYDTDWKFCPDRLAGTHRNDHVEEIPCPRTFEQMKEAARILSQGIPQVRVDFYEIDGKLYFGELTFTSQGGYMNYISHEELLRLGGKVPLPEN